MHPSIIEEKIVFGGSSLIAVSLHLISLIRGAIQGSELEARTTEDDSNGSVSLWVTSPMENNSSDSGQRSPVRSPAFDLPHPRSDSG